MYMYMYIHMYTYVRKKVHVGQFVPERHAARVISISVVSVDVIMETGIT